MGTFVTPAVARQLVAPEGVSLEVHRVSGGAATDLPIVAAHPSAVFGAGTARLLSELAETETLTVNPRGIGASDGPSCDGFERIVDDIEAVRRHLGIERWVFWGMSGGGWLALLYAHRHPAALAGIIVESACACFRRRLADPSCALSPFFPSYRRALTTHDLLDESSHDDASSAGDTEWTYLVGLGEVFKKRGGPALAVSPVGVDRDMKRLMALLWSFDARPWIESVRTPALVIAGSADPIVPFERVRDVHEALAGSELVVAEGGGHVPSADGHPAALGAVRRFLASRGARPETAEPVNES